MVTGGYATMGRIPDGAIAIDYQIRASTKLVEAGRDLRRTPPKDFVPPSSKKDRSIINESAMDGSCWQPLDNNDIRKWSPALTTTAGASWSPIELPDDCLEEFVDRILEEGDVYDDEGVESPGTIVLDDGTGTDDINEHEEVLGKLIHKVGATAGAAIRNDMDENTMVQSDITVSRHVLGGNLHMMEIKIQVWNPSHPLPNLPPPPPKRRRVRNNKICKLCNNPICRRPYNRTGICNN